MSNNKLVDAIVNDMRDTIKEIFEMLTQECSDSDLVISKHKLMDLMVTYEDIAKDYNSNHYMYEDYEPVEENARKVVTRLFGKIV